MNFVSFNFIVLCMITVCGYYILPVKYRWVFIMAANVVFYQSAGYRALGYIVLVAAVSWIGCLELTRMHQKEAEFLKVNYPGAKVYLNGTPVLEENWKEKGIHLVEEDPDVAVQSFDTTLTYHKLDRICHYVRNGVPFIATHMDTNCPTEYGFMPDCGAMCSLITDSTGVKPRFLGKPWKETVDMVAEITGYKAEEMAFVGDRLYTDVATGVNNGAKGFLVLTGEADMQTVAESDVEPTCIYDSLGEMRRYL